MGVLSHRRGVLATLALAGALIAAASASGARAADERARARETRAVLAALEQASDDAYRTLRAAYEGARTWPPQGAEGDLWRLVEQIEADIDRLEARYRDDDDARDAASAFGRLAARFEALDWLAPREPANAEARRALASLRARGRDLVALWRDVLEAENERRGEIVPRRTLSGGEAEALRRELVALGRAVEPLQTLLPESFAPVDEAATAAASAAESDAQGEATTREPEPDGNASPDASGEVVITMREAKVVSADDPSIGADPGDDSWRERRGEALLSELAWFCAVARETARAAGDAGVRTETIEARLGLLLRTARHVDLAVARTEDGAPRALLDRWSEARRALAAAARVTGVTLETP